MHIAPCLIHRAVPCFKLDTHGSERRTTGTKGYDWYLWSIQISSFQARSASGAKKPHLNRIQTFRGDQTLCPNCNVLCLISNGARRSCVDETTSELAGVQDHPPPVLCGKEASEFSRLQWESNSRYRRRPSILDRILRIRRGRCWD